MRLPGAAAGSHDGAMEPERRAPTGPRDAGRNPTSPSLRWRAPARDRARDAADVGPPLRHRPLCPRSRTAPPLRPGRPRAAGADAACTRAWGRGRRRRPARYALADGQRRRPPTLVQHGGPGATAGRRRCCGCRARATDARGLGRAGARVGLPGGARPCSPKRSPRSASSPRGTRSRGPCCRPWRSGGPTTGAGRGDRAPAQRVRHRGVRRARVGAADRGARAAGRCCSRACRGEHAHAAAAVLGAALATQGVRVPAAGRRPARPTALVAAVRRTAPAAVVLWSQLPATADVAVLRCAAATPGRGASTFVGGPRLGRTSELPPGCSASPPSLQAVDAWSRPRVSRAAGGRGCRGGGVRGGRRPRSARTAPARDAARSGGWSPSRWAGRAATPRRRRSSRGLLADPARAAAASPRTPPSPCAAHRRQLGGHAAARSADALGLRLAAAARRVRRTMSPADGADAGAGRRVDRARGRRARRAGRRRDRAGRPGRGRPAARRRGSRSRRTRPGGPRSGRAGCGPSWPCVTRTGRAAVAPAEAALAAARRGRVAAARAQVPDRARRSAGRPQRVTTAADAVTELDAATCGVRRGRGCSRCAGRPASPRLTCSP